MNRARVTATVHRAGPLSAEGIQRCLRCPEILIDYRGAMVCGEDATVGSWEPDGLVAVIKGNPTHYYAIEGRPLDGDETPCERVGSA